MWPGTSGQRVLESGMSVPPVMMAQVASRVWKYWLSKL